MVSPPSSSPIGLYGLGIIGSRVADHLKAAGCKLRTWSRSSREREDFEADPARLAAASDILLLFLKDAPAIRDTFERLRSTLRPGSLVINHATIDATTTTFLEASCAEAGCAFLNAPFTGSRNAARDAALVYYAGGSPDALERARPVLEISSRQIIPLPSSKQATVIKLVTNLITSCTVQALAESLQIAKSQEVSPETLLSALAENACGSLLTAMKLPSMADGDYDPHFSLSNMLKDSRYALELAEQAGLATPALREVSHQMALLDEQGFGEKDFSILNTQFS